MIVGIIGAGAMGSGIAQVASTAGCQVRIFDNAPAALQKSKKALEKIMNRLVEKGRLTSEKAADIQNNIKYSSSLLELQDSDLIIEAIIENLDIKKSVFAELGMMVQNTCIIASNTSSLSITSLAASLNQPERFLGIHFFNPAPLMKLVEIIPAFQTDPEVVKKAKAIIDSWGKQTVIAKDTPGFIVNKVARPFYSESLRIYEEGISDITTIDWALKEIGGFRMGPFTLMDFIGLDVNYAVTESVFQAFYYDPRYKPAFTQKRLTEAGYLGRKSGRGFYDYNEGATQPEPNKDSALGQQIVDRVVAMLINEAADTLHFNIANLQDIETAMTTGVNYPKGLFAWADEIGINEVVNRLDALYNEYHEDRYRCSPLLRKLQRTNGHFHPQNESANV